MGSTVKRRLLIVLAGAIGLTLMAGPSSASVRTTHNDYWGCVGIYAIDLGLCVKDPLPKIPDLPDLPRPPGV